MAKLARIIILSNRPYSRTVIKIINQDHKTFTVQATEQRPSILLLVVRLIVMTPTCLALLSCQSVYPPVACTLNVNNHKLCFSLPHTLQSYFTFQAMAKLARIIILSHWPYSRTVITIVNQDRKTFMVQATEYRPRASFSFVSFG